MDSQENNEAEAQTTKVAETELTNRGNTSTDTPIMDSEQKESTLDTASNHKSAPEKDSPSISSPAPERQAPHRSRSPSQPPKRRPSRSPSPSTKRQRTSPSPAASQAAPRDAPPRVRPLDDKARTRRLFGGMLSTIAAKPSQRSIRREPRDMGRGVGMDAEKRGVLERELERKKMEDEEEARREKEVGRREGKRERWGVWERDTMTARFENERLRARFLRTSSKPELYYKPYILTRDQKATLDQQVEDAETGIEREVRRFEDMHPEQAPLPWKRFERGHKRGENTGRTPLESQDSLEGGRTDGDAGAGGEEEGGEEKLGEEVREEPSSKMARVEERISPQKDRTRTDEDEEDVVETAEGDVSLIY